MRDSGGICSETLRAHLTVLLPCHHVFHRSCVEKVLRYARYIASSGRLAIDCIMCGAPATVSLLPMFHHDSDDRPLPRQVRAVRAEDGAGGEDVDGPVEPWHMFARRQDVRFGSAVVLALHQKTLPSLRTPLVFLIAGGETGFAYPGS